MNVTAGGAMALHIAADNGSPDIIKALLQAGADPNASDEVTSKQFIVSLFSCSDSTFY